MDFNDKNIKNKIPTISLSQNTLWLFAGQGSLNAKKYRAI